jgi:hypothetical protein
MRVFLVDPLGILKRWGILIGYDFRDDRIRWLEWGINRRFRGLLVGLIGIESAFRRRARIPKATAEHLC